MSQETTSRIELIEEVAELQRELETMGPLAARTERAEAEFVRFFAQSLDLMCIAGLDGYFKYLNPAWTTRLGWTVEELQEKPFLHFVHPEDREATLAEIDVLAQGEDTISFENRYLHRNGSYRRLRWSARPVPGRQRVYATARDVTRQHRLEREILEIVDRERERLGRELHDGLCQALAGIAALSATLSRKLSAAFSPGSAAAAEEISTLLHEAIGQARDLARGLGPVGLDEVGLPGVLDTMTQNVERLFCIPCTFECDGSVDGLGKEVAAHLFRIAQEAVNNAMAHAGPGRIEICLGSEEGGGFLYVRDDGAGLPETARDSEGIGMHTMAYRARLIGGSLAVRPRAGGGTVVCCSFPLSEARLDGSDHAHGNA